MIEHRTHQGRWTQTLREAARPTEPEDSAVRALRRAIPSTGERLGWAALPAVPCAVSLPARFRAWLRRQRNPRQPGRRRIDPALPWGHWAAGWTSPTKKAP